MFRSNNKRQVHYEIPEVVSKRENDGMAVRLAEGGDVPRKAGRCHRLGVCIRSVSDVWRTDGPVQRRGRRMAAQLSRVAGSELPRLSFANCVAVAISPMGSRPLRRRAPDSQLERVCQCRRGAARYRRVVLLCGTSRIDRLFRSASPPSMPESWRRGMKPDPEDDD